MRRIQASLALFSLFAWSAALSGQTMNSLTAQERPQGWQLLFDGKTLEGWHPSVPAQGQGRVGAPQPAQPGALAQVGSTPKPCVTALERSASDVPAGSSHWEVVDGLLMPCGEPIGCAIVNTAKTARDYRFNPDQWNRYQITAEGDHIVVVLNGETTLDIHDARFSEGNLRLQYQQFPIAFRNIKIRPLP